MTLILKSFALGGIKCYYCRHLEGDCNANIAGEIVECQMSNPRENLYGDACFVGYSGNIKIRYCESSHNIVVILRSILKTWSKVNYLI